MIKKKLFVRSYSITFEKKQKSAERKIGFFLVNDMQTRNVSACSETNEKSNFRFIVFEIWSFKIQPVGSKEINPKGGVMFRK